MNTINEAHNEVKERLVKALDDAKHRMLLLDLLEKYPGSYEGLIAFAEECEPVYNGNWEAFEFALDELAPEIDENGRLSFEIPYSRYAWNPEENAWRCVNEEDEEDMKSEEDEEDMESEEDEEDGLKKFSLSSKSTQVFRLKLWQKVFRSDPKGS